ncbi:hypothetical protein D3C80_1698590 [compost metagenome]
MTLIDPGDDRHQFDCIDAELLQMSDDGRMGKCRNRSALFRRDIGMQHGEGLDRQLVDETTLG